MVITVGFVFFIVALVCLILATAAIPSPARFQWFPAGVLFIVLALMCGGINFRF